MPRRREVRKQQIPPDPKYNDRTVAKFINCLLIQGKKSLAERILYTALETIGQRTGKEPLEVFYAAIENAKPVVEVKSRRVGGSTYQVPVEVRPERQLALALRWIIGYAHARPERGMANQLAAELLDAANGRGATIKKREDTHRMAEANKAFAHYRW
ncbi:MAG: 30S ribosomal protein S7 [Bradymonadales bacterium]|nr:30S ribosomal protein S7 [Bradymonadales bacterium]